MDVNYGTEEGTETTYPLEWCSALSPGGVRVSLVVRDRLADGHWPIAKDTRAEVQLTKPGAWVYVSFPDGSDLPGVYIHGDGSIRL